MKNTVDVDINMINRLNDDINKRFADIPFGNSKFQNDNFVVNAQFTPARAYRAIGLALSERIRALKDANFKYQLELVGIEELQNELTYSTQLGMFDKRRKEILLAEKLSNKPYLVKAVNDAAFEVETFMSMLDQFPYYTREQFEAEEKEHFEKKLLLQVAGVQGAHESLFCMGHMTKQTAAQVLNEPDYQQITERIATKHIEKK